MSDSTFATEFWSSTVANYCGLAATTILVYEYLLKFPDEVELFWKRKWTGASVLFFTNRSIALLHQVLANVNVLVLTKESCQAYVKTDIIIDLLQYVPWAGFAALRAYALSFNYGISGLILALSMVPIAGVGWQSAMYDNQGVVIPELGCLTLSLASTQVAVRVTIATRSALILADLMAICVTWLALHRQYNGILGKHTLQYILMRDGTVQFTVLLVLNTLYLVFGVLSMTNTDGLQYTSYVLIFTEPATAILMSRFMLNLQAVDKRNRDHNSTLGEIGSQGRSDSLVFQRVVGSLRMRMTDDDEEDDHTGSVGPAGEQRPSDAAGEPNGVGEE